MCKANKGEIPNKLDKKFSKLYSLHSHDKRLTSNMFHFSQISCLIVNKLWPTKVYGSE